MNYPELVIEVTFIDGEVHGEPVTHFYAKEAIVNGYLTTFHGNTSRPMMMVYNDDQGFSHIARQSYSDDRPLDEEL